MKTKNVGILSAILGSICCVAPLLLVALGLGTFAAVIGRYHWFFIGSAAVVLAWAWVKHFREQARCACEHRSVNGRGLTLVTLLLASAIVGVFAVLNIGSYVFASSAPAVASVSSANLQRVVILVDGMSCVTCEIPVRHALRKIDGVKSVQVSAASKTATVDYEPAKTNPEQLVTAINSTGYHATLSKK